ncbi:hypothetical protein QYM36_005192 [Artemia franciscana]|uniref:Uncharacterized protein n=1 Tax=Artemia franciscana TaxID=6661 RepID=A0AA88I218_ARTSF|nr:hypothetical protein QYM36_005192 [Artemia franciscana]
MNNEKIYSLGLTQPASFEKKDNLQGLKDLKESNEGERSEASPNSHQADENYDNEVFGSIQDVEQEVFPESSRHFLPRNKDLEQKNREEEDRFQFGQTLNAEQGRIGQEHTGVTHQADENYNNEVFGSVQDVEQEVFPESSGSRYWLPRNKDVEQKNREEEDRFQFGQTLNAEQGRIGREHTGEEIEGRNQPCTRKSSKRELYDAVPSNLLDLEVLQNNSAGKYAGRRESSGQDSSVDGYNSREQTRNYCRSPQRPRRELSNHLNYKRKLNPANHVFKEVEESQKDPRNQKSSNVFQSDEKEIRKYTSRCGTPSRQYGARDSLAGREYRRSYSRHQQRHRREPNDCFYKPYYERPKNYGNYKNKDYRYSRPSYRIRYDWGPYEKFRYSQNARTTKNSREDERYRYRSPIHSLRGTYHGKFSTPRNTYREQSRREEHAYDSKGNEYINVLRRKRAGDYIENNKEKKIYYSAYQGEPRVEKRRF